jgi:hypothetical protein
MPIDPTLGLRIALDTFWYNLLLNLAGLHWGLLRGFIMMGYIVEMINRWLAQNAFAPLIQMTNDTLRVATGLSFVVALFVLAITYLLAAFVRANVVNPRSAILWYIAGALFFTIGPSLYQGMNEFRLRIAEDFYLSALNGIQGSAGGAFGSLGQVQSSDLAIGIICDHLGPYLPGATGAGRTDGLDVALAYLRADGPDVMGYPQPLFSPGCPAHLFNPVIGAYVSPIPQEWYFPGSYFDVTQGPPLVFDTMTDAQRAASIATASSSQGRLLTAWPLVLFGVVEQLTYLLITIAQGLTFISFGVAILFAFFKRTEAIANSIVNQWIELIVQTVIIALIQALVVAMFLAGTAANNGMVVLGIGLICLVFMVITLWSGVKAVWNSFNRLFNAFGQATGGAVISPGTAAVTAGAAAAGFTGAVVSVGSSATAGMSALMNGATPAQATGLMFGGVQPLADAVRTITRLPSLRGTPMGDAAEQFTEAAITRRVAREIPIVGGVVGPMIGATLLTDYDPEKAEYDDKGRLIRRPMLVPAVGEGLEALTYPLGKRPIKRRAVEGELDWFEDEDGELFPGFTALKPKRSGMFTPVASTQTPTTASVDKEIVRERQTYADDMRGEEMEEHITDVARSTSAKSGSTTGSDPIEGAAGRLEKSAEALERAAASLVGSLRISGSADVSSVMGDVMRLLGGRGVNGVDHLTVAGLMARSVGMMPLDDGKPPVREDLARFGLFVDSAARLGLSPEMTERVGREVKETPDRRLTPDTRTELVESAMISGRSRDEAEREVNRLEIAARLLPNEMTAYGSMPVPSITVAPEVKVEPVINISTDDQDSDYDAAMRSSASMSGSQAVLGGTE